MQLTLTQLITKVRRRAGIEESAFISASEVSVTDEYITDMINEAAAYLYQHLAGTTEAYYETKTQLTVAAGATSASLPEDFFRIIALDKMVGSDGYREVPDMTIAERNDHRGYFGYVTHAYGSVPAYRLSQTSLELLPESCAPGTYHLRYVPQYTNLEEGSDTITFPMNWLDYVVCYAAIQCMVKLMLPTEDLSVQLMKLERMLVRGAARRGQPRRMLNLRGRTSWW